MPRMNEDTEHDTYGCYRTLTNTLTLTHTLTQHTKLAGGAARLGLVALPVVSLSLFKISPTPTQRTNVSVNAIVYVSVCGSM